MEPLIFQSCALTVEKMLLLRIGKEKGGKWEQETRDVLDKN